MFISMISAALVEGTIFTMHGGLSPDLTSLEQVGDRQLFHKLLYQKLLKNSLIQCFLSCNRHFHHLYHKIYFSLSIGLFS